MNGFRWIRVRPGPALLAVVVLFSSPLTAAAQTQADFFDDGVVQEVRLVISSRDWQALKDNADENTYYPADLTWKGTTVRNVGIRSRGSGTRNAIKPGLRVDLNHYVANQEFLGLKAFVLDNAYTDKTTLRETVTMKIFQRMGIPAAREAHARLYVNNDYAGLYVIVESIDRTFVSRVFGADEARLETGGYLFEYRWNFLYYWEFLGPDLDTYAPIFRPQTRDTDSMAAIYRPVEEAIRAINESHDEDFAAAAGHYLDLEELMKLLAVETFVVEWDGFAGNWATNNFYLYRFSSGQHAQVIPWDRDNAFQFVDTDIMLRLDENVLTRRALKVPALRGAYLDALSACVRLAEETGGDDPRGWLEREIDRQARQIEAAVAQDTRFPFSFDEFETDVEYLRSFARRRPAFVQCQVDNTIDLDEPQRDCNPLLVAPIQGARFAPPSRTR